MPSTASVAILGTGVCPYCQEPSVLYTHSLAHTMPLVHWTGDSMTRHYAGCSHCENNNIRNSFRYGSVPEEMTAELESIQEQLLTLTPYQTSNCESCERPLLDSSSLNNALEPYTELRYLATQAQTTLDDERTIIVHRRCSYTTNCCDRVLSNMSQEMMVVIYNREGSLCRQCLQVEMGERT